jgi:hypothetical protein
MQNPEATDMVREICCIMEHKMLLFHTKLPVYRFFIIKKKIFFLSLAFRIKQVLLYVTDRISCNNDMYLKLSSKVGA